MAERKKVTWADAEIIEICNSLPDESYFFARDTDTAFDKDAMFMFRSLQINLVSRKKNERTHSKIISTTFVYHFPSPTTSASTMFTCCHHFNEIFTRLIASHQGDPGSIPGRVTLDFPMWESRRTMPLVGEFFFRGSPVSPALSFRRCSILTSITLIGSQYLNPIAVRCRPVPKKYGFLSGEERIKAVHDKPMRVIEVIIEHRRIERAGERDIPELPTCEDLGARNRTQFAQFFAQPYESTASRSLALSLCEMETTTLSLLYDVTQTADAKKAGNRAKLKSLRLTKAAAAGLTGGLVLDECEHRGVPDGSLQESHDGVEHPRAVLLHGRLHDDSARPRHTVVDLR
ncbi:hypothetical protein PR048_003344 [Dryococelus australis]|uniref:Uncharacterized protein n=1 Tax=Dryococelus australis TaxID=614101 RepID=A0ABQ9IP58_9NEOP|nr:hypothetical protein PR048_003344 [Dryococelus australis]